MSNASSAVVAVMLAAAGCATAAQPAREPASAAARTQPSSSQPACPEGPAGVALPALTQEPAPATIERLGTGLPVYERTGAVWLPAGPVVVNEDFDFATAMSLDGVGAGLAAAKRKQANERKAELLSELRFDGEARRELDRLRACGVHAYALLWGSAGAATLRLVADRFDADGELIAHAALETDTLPIEDWARPGALHNAILRALPELQAQLRAGRR